MLFLVIYNDYTSLRVPQKFHCSLLYISGRDWRVKLPNLTDSLYPLPVKTHQACINLRNNLWQSGVDMSAPVHPVATPLTIMQPIGTAA